MIDYISLAEYAEIHGVQQVTVRQRILRGGLPSARKIGRNWVIDRNEPYPDGRVKSGKYRDWRKTEDGPTRATERESHA